MKVVIAGSRSIDHTEYSHFTHLERLCDRFEQEHGNITMVVSGMAAGPDKLGIIYARDRGLHLAEFPAKWDLYKKRAGPIRNGEMGKFADAAIIMWDGESKGSKHMAEVMENLNKPFILDIFTPVVYKVRHLPSGIIKRSIQSYPTLDDFEHDL